MSTNAWDQAKQFADKHASTNGLFVRLTSDGDKVLGAFCGDPFVRQVLWTGERYESYDPENPDHRGAGKRPSMRVSLNFFVPSDNAMKVVEGNAQWFKDVCKVRDKYGLDKVLFEIERHGESGDPKTTYTILPDAPIDAELRQRIAAAALHDLAAVVGGDADRGAPEAASGPIAGAAAGDLITRLKALKRSAVDQFLATFKVQRVRDLKASDEPAARALLGKLEGQGRGDVDPFAD